MALTLTRKAPVQSIAPKGDEAPPTERQTQALVDLGILPPTPSKGGLTLTHKKASPVSRPLNVFMVGYRVRVTNDLYGWITHWNVGDTGVVIRSVPHSYGASDEDRKRYAVVEVKLDKPRPPEKRLTCLFHAWELEPIVGAPS